MTIGRPTFLSKISVMQPRTVCGCQSRAAAIYLAVTPSGPRGMTIMRCVFVSEAAASSIVQVAASGANLTFGSSIWRSNRRTHTERRTVPCFDAPGVLGPTQNEARYDPADQRSKDAFNVNCIQPVTSGNTGEHQDHGYQHGQADECRPHRCTTRQPAPILPVAPADFELHESGNLPAQASLQFDLTDDGRVSVRTSARGVDLPSPLPLDDVTPQWLEKIATDVFIAVAEGRTR
jgi:hypothetical protein